MRKKNDNITDDEIRIIGDYVAAAGSDDGQGAYKKERKRKKYLAMGAAIILLLCIAILLFFVLNKRQQVAPDEEGQHPNSEISAQMQSFSSACLLTKDTVINDIPLQIIEPKNCQMKLRMGKYEDNDDILLAMLAADVRADKDLPVGSFVLDGELISKGNSKYGYCAIIGKEVTIGRQLETALFERCIEKNGSFFRQYSLVSNGKQIEIKPKGKTFRRALCYWNGKFQVVLTKDEESYHDFSQALVDLGVTEAISLVGGGALIKYIDENGNSVVQGTVVSDQLKSVSYLVWTRS